MTDLLRDTIRLTKRIWPNVPKTGILLGLGRKRKMRSYKSNGMTCRKWVRHPSRLTNIYSLLRLHIEVAELFILHSRRNIGKSVWPKRSKNMWNAGAIGSIILPMQKGTSTFNCLLEKAYKTEKASNKFEAFCLHCS